MKTKLLIILMVIVLLISLISCSPIDKVSQNTTTTETTIETTTTETEELVKLLELLDYKNIREYGFITIKGEVKNISDKRLENVLVVVYYFDENDEFIKTAEALIDYNPIMPGQISPFEAITTDNPLITNYIVTFKFMFGEFIPIINSRNKE